MTTKKNLMIVVLATFCLTTSMLAIRSYAGWPYDPWSDINDDGKIRIDDVLDVASRFGTDGDPTRNVIIANHTTYQWTGGTDVPGGGEWAIINSTNGYSKITVIVQVFPAGSHVTLNVQWFIISASGPWPVGYNIDILDLATNSNWGKTYDTAGSEIHLVLHNYETSAVYLVVGIYMTT